MRDDALQQEVFDELKFEPRINPAEIVVEAEDGKVTLSGKVRSWVERDEADRVAWAAPGVSEVENHIVIFAP